MIKLYIVLALLVLVVLEFLSFNNEMASLAYMICVTIMAATLFIVITIENKK